MVVHDPAGLHRGVDGRRPEEAEASGARRLASARTPGVDGDPVGRRAGARMRGGRVPPEELLRAARPGARRAIVARGVGDRRLDLPAMTNDRGVSEQPYDVGLAEARQPGPGRSPKTPPGRLALAKDRESREPDWKPSRQESLVDPALVAHRAAPLLVVIDDVERVGRSASSGRRTARRAAQWLR